MTVAVLLEGESPKADFAQASILAASPSNEPVSLDEAKAHLRVVFADEDEYILGLISAARCMLEGRINRALTPQTVSFTLTHFYNGIKLPRVPVIGDVEINYTDEAGELVVLDQTTYLATDDEPPLLYPARGERFPALVPWHGNVRVQYTAGYSTPADVPASLKRWILLAIGTLYEHRATTVVGASVAELPEDFMRMLWQPYMVYV